VKDENGDLFADSHNILNRWENYFSQLLNVHNVSDVRQIEVHTVEPLVSGPSRLEVEIAIAKLKKCILPGSDDIPVELIEAGGEMLVFEIQKLINSVWIKEKFPDKWKEPIIVLVQKKSVKTDCNNYRGMSLLSTTYKILSNILFSTLSGKQMKLLEIMSVGFDVTDQLLIRFSVFVRYWRKNGSTRDSASAIHRLQESL
jgi:hypothetical protein